MTLVLAVILQLNAYLLLLLLLRSPINYDQLLQVSLLGFSITETTSRYKAYWFLGKWALNYYYLIYLADLINSATTSADICCQLVGLLLLSIATYFLPTARLHFFTALLYLHVHSICTSVDVVDPFMEHQVKTNKQILNFPLP